MQQLRNTIRFEKLLASALSLCLPILFFSCLHAQKHDVGYAPSPLTSGLVEALDLQGIWLDESGYRHIVPVQYFDRKEMQLNRSFDLAGYADLEDTVYLYFEAVAWSSEIWLNDMLLKVTEDPFEEHLLPLAKGLLRPEGNELVVRMHTEGRPYEWYPERFVGIFRQVSLLRPDSVYWMPDFPEAMPRAGRVSMLAPWSHDKGYLEDSLVIKKSVQGLFSYPYPDVITFPFRPSNASFLMLGRMNRRILADPMKADSLAIYNHFPFSQDFSNWHLKFWRNQDFVPTGYYGTFESSSALGIAPIKSPDKMALLVFLLLPILGLMTLKLGAPRAYSSMLEYITKNKIYLELIVNNKFLKSGQLWLMNLVRMLLTSTTVALFLYFLERSGNLSLLNLVSDKSLIWEGMQGQASSPYEIFLYVFAWIAGLNLLKYFFLNTVSQIFRVHGFSTTIQNLDVFAAFPLVVLPFIPASFIFFLEPHAGKVVMYIWLGLFMVYSIRRVYLIFSGLGRLYQISGSLKFLYICTLEILPWLLLI